MHRPTSGLALVAAVAIAPLVVAIGLLVPVHDGPHADVLTSVGFLPIVYLFAVGLMILLGLPMYLLGRRLRLVRWWSAIIVGLAAGVTADVVVRDLRLPSATELCRFAAIGASAAWSFWLILHVAGQTSAHTKQG